MVETTHEKRSKYFVTNASSSKIQLGGSPNFQDIGGLIVSTWHNTQILLGEFGNMACLGIL
jgi:hypothetical protein